MSFKINKDNTQQLDRNNDLTSSPNSAMGVPCVFFAVFWLWVVAVAARLDDLCEEEDLSIVVLVALDLLLLVPTILLIVMATGSSYCL